MSARIRWRPTGDGQSLDVGAPSIFWETLQALTDSNASEVVVDANHANGIRALIKSNPFQSENGWTKLLEAVEAHGSVVVFREW